MRGPRLRRASAAAGALLVATMAGAFLSGGMASAAAKVVTCTSLTGNLNSTPPATFTLGGCTGNTGGSGTAQGNSITWKNGLSTFLTSAAFTPAGKPREANCGPLSDRYAIADSVGRDTTGSIRARGKVSAQVCILNESPDPWSLAPGSVLTLR